MLPIATPSHVHRGDSLRQFQHAEARPCWGREACPPAISHRCRRGRPCHDAAKRKSGYRIGICHAELMTAFSESSGKVSVVSLLDSDKALRPPGPQNVRFQEYVDRANLFRGASTTTPDNAIQEAEKAVREAVLNLVHQGAREVKRSRYNAGPALGCRRSSAGSWKKGPLSSICHPCGHERPGSP